MRQSFELECRDRSITFEWLSFDGDPVGTLYLATETRDLIITGHDTAFYGETLEPLSAVLAKLLLLTPRPIIVCPDTDPKLGDVLIAYDGSIPAMRALQIFVMLALGIGRRISVVAVDESQEIAARRAAAAASYLHIHGYEAEANPIASTLNPEQVIRAAVADRGIETMVMGAYGHRGFREALFGSTTTALAENPPCALFLYH